jgi:hypothetical protein
VPNHRLCEVAQCLRHNWEFATNTWEQLETAFVERKPYGRYCTVPLSVIGSLHSGRIEVECDGQVLRVRMDPIREGDF